MQKSFFFYDLETSGFNPRYDRIMQFAGRRVNMKLEPIGDPVNVLIKLPDDCLPSPGAILTTGITPQQTLTDGITEAEFCHFFLEEIAQPGTIMVGYNNIRFDDEFIRHTLWRCFHDPYEWAWSDGRGRWDLLDVTRFVRALRPDGITWPTREVVDKNGQTVTVPTVNLVDMARTNGFENTNAHDALADVEALLSLARLIKSKQPKMWDYLFNHRDKTSLASVVRLDDPVPFVYSSGRLSSANEKTTAAIVIGAGRQPDNPLVWDLRYRVSDYSQLDDRAIRDKLFASWEKRRQPDFAPLPVKELGLKKCPAIAPIGTLDPRSQERINLRMDQVETNWQDLRDNSQFLARLVKIWQSQPKPALARDVEGQLYDGFLPKQDQTNLRLVAAADEKALSELHPQFTDKRLGELLLRYKARNYPRSLTEAEQAQWEAYRAQKLTAAIPDYMSELAKLASSGADEFILQELQLWAESIVPVAY